MCSFCTSSHVAYCYTGIQISRLTCCIPELLVTVMHLENASAHHSFSVTWEEEVGDSLVSVSDYSTLVKNILRYNRFVHFYGIKSSFSWQRYFYYVIQILF